MKLFARLIVMFFISAILLLQFQNCSNYSDNSMFSSSGSSTAASASDPSLVTFDVTTTSTPPRADNIQIGGTCNVGGRKNNFISYQVYAPYITNRGCATAPYPTPVPVPSSSSGLIAINPSSSAGVSCNTQVLPTTLTIRSDARCENGQFYIVIPILCPNQGGPYVAGGPSQSVSAQVNISLTVYDSIDANNNLVNSPAPTTREFPVYIPRQPVAECYYSDN